MLDAIIFDTKPDSDPHNEPDAVVVWLHGLGADGNDFAPIAPQLAPTNKAVRFIFPHADEIPVSINNGYVMRAWYDIESTDLRDRQDVNGTQTSQRQIEAIINEQINKGIDSRRIILAGFSQGGAIALYTGLRFSQPLAGIIALSTYLPLANTTESEAHSANSAIPIFFGHGEQDPVVPIAAGTESKLLLEQLGYSIQWHSYPMEHSVCPEEITHVAKWIENRL